MRWAALCALLAAGCTQSRTLAWELVFDDPSLSARAAVVRGTVLEGGCGSDSAIFSAAVARGETPSMPAALAPGRYGFLGVALDASCTEVARGCVDVILPLGEGETLAVTMRATTPVPACLPTSCVAGFCGRDAGVPLDAPGDAASDAPRDVPRDVPGDLGEPVDAPVRPLPIGDRIQVDFGPVAAIGWATHATLEGETGPLTTVGGVDTDVVVASVGFTGEQTGGSFVNELGLPPEVSSDTLWVGTFDGHDLALTLEAVVTLRGVPDGTYAIELFASRDGDDGGPGRLTRYRIGAAEMDLDAQDNTSRLATFEDVRPDAGGQIVLRVGVSPAGTARFGYLGSLVLIRRS